MRGEEKVLRCANRGSHPLQILTFPKHAQGGYYLTGKAGLSSPKEIDRVHNRQSRRR